MMINIGFDLFLSDRTNRATKIAACPQMLSPVSFFEQGKLILQLTGRHPFDELSNLSWREGRWTRHHQMNVVAADMTFQDRNFAASTDLSDDLSCAFCRLSAQHLITILRHPHKVILYI